MADEQHVQGGPESSASRRRETRARHFAARRALMAERDDLRGVYAFADYLDDAVRWSA